MIRLIGNRHYTLYLTGSILLFVFSSANAVCDSKLLFTRWKGGARGTKVVDFFLCR